MEKAVKYEMVRRELEKKYTHVTFVRTYNKGRKYETQLWYVNDEMEEVIIRSEWTIKETLYRVELAKLRNVRKYSKKYTLFAKLMKQGKIALDHTLYKKLTLKQLQEVK